MIYNDYNNIFFVNDVIKSLKEFSSVFSYIYIIFNHKLYIIMQKYYFLLLT